MEDGGQVSAGATAGVEDADVRAGEAEGLIELGAEEMVDALDLILDNLLRGVPDAEVFAELRVEGFEEGLVEVGDSFFALEDVEELGLDAVEGVASEFEDLGELDGVEVGAVGDLAKSSRRMGTFR